MPINAPGETNPLGKDQSQFIPWAIPKSRGASPIGPLWEDSWHDLPSVLGGQTKRPTLRIRKAGLVWVPMILLVVVVSALPHGLSAIPELLCPLRMHPNHEAAISHVDNLDQLSGLHQQLQGR
ncbi:hypothetical protein D9M68_343580 [compost metagenome]